MFQIGLNMLQGEQSKVQQPGDGAADKSRAAQLSVAVSPLAVPILAGPGTIATAMNFVAVRSFTHLAITIGAFGFDVRYQLRGFRLRREAHQIHWRECRQRGHQNEGPDLT